MGSNYTILMFIPGSFQWYQGSYCSLTNNNSCTYLLTGDCYNRVSRRHSQHLVVCKHIERHTNTHQTRVIQIVDLKVAIVNRLISLVNLQQRIYVPCCLSFCVSLFLNDNVDTPINEELISAHDRLAGSMWQLWHFCVFLWILPSIAVECCLIVSVMFLPSFRLFCVLCWVSSRSRSLAIAQPALAL